MMTLIGAAFLAGCFLAGFLAMRRHMRVACAY
jgi:hypothetical protein